MTRLTNLHKFLLSTPFGKLKLSKTPGSKNIVAIKIIGKIKF